MENRRQFIRVLFGLIATFITFKYYRIANAMKSLPYHHLPNGTFRNLPGSPTRRKITRSSKGFFYFFYKGIIKREMFDQKEVPENIPLKHSLTQEKAIFNYHNNKDKITITWLGHAAFLIKLGRENMLIDPFLSKTAGPFGIGPNRYIPSGIKISDLPKIKYILVSHNHYDHLDDKTLIKIKNKKNIFVICPLNLYKNFSKLGYEKIIELDWNKEKKINDVNFIATPAYHWSRRLGQKYNSTLWNGYIIEYENKKIYFCGDTAFGPMFLDIGKKYGPFDLTIVPIGAYEPRDMMQASHCTPEEAVKISSMVNSKNILGMHWGTIRLSAENPWEPPNKFRKEAILNGYNEKNIWQLSIGETKSLL
ncbi:MAG: hypothetical protein CFH19_01062 [Alphaproteobacteria bacterium MarineAlpha5_Bin9]|nr:MAG: hypothetical protein CFH19_01062 [Alphaproteobacteria bacterium MarineAlpha5_Bin9]|tara:strand:+ start:2561 stop:3652 length:1092 start_codon:yes stop_codon:yes gene_type:complete